ncbi:LD-carboxypeptidase [Sphingosinicella sp. BN140058]|uniref:S66 peptidase family protein n=1 Tax=Sphingosinicella sp. BN140058 TaxID=1892855 RepID=UPI00101395BB|nr:LD-carboxypeptidase [Sphingosinicella sp. BN140058]QAY78294.1 LD-carboxypeptidase [Sphingosinicella sp. BN140058]
MLSRRNLVAAMGALMTLPGVEPASAGTPPSKGKAPRLRPGDVVGLVAPAMFSDGGEELAAIEANIAALGLVPKIGPHVTARYGYLAGSDRNRADDLNRMYADPAVRAVFAVHGGWGSARILPFLDWKTIAANPKLLIGFSDITALHLAFAAKAGFATIHGPNAGNSWQPISAGSFTSLAFAGEMPLLRNPAPLILPAPLPAGADPGANAPGTPFGAAPAPATSETPVAAQVDPRWRTTAIRPGRAQGRLIGGNLAVLAALVGSSWMPDFTGAILVLEETGEAEYRIDRMLTQLSYAGILGKVAGIVFGQCTRCVGGAAGYSGFTVPQLLFHHFAPLGVPAFYGANIGHVANQLCIPFGVRADIDAAAGTIQILEPAVS